MRRLPWIGVLLAVLIGAGWWMFFIGPRDTEKSRLESELVSAVDREQRLRVQIRQLEEIRDREVQYLVATARLEQLIPDEPRLDEIIEEIHQLTLDTGIDLVALTPALPAVTASDSELRQIVITTRVDGEFFQVLGFLFGLHDLDRLVRVDAVAISSSQDELGFTRLAVSLQLRLFTLADVLPELAEPLPPIEDPSEEDGADGDGSEGGDQDEQGEGGGG